MKGLVVPAVAVTEHQLACLRARRARRARALRRSVHIRHVAAGPDGTEEWEILALFNPVYDVHRLGIFFTASPRHADILLVTCTGTHGMAAPLARTFEAMPRPVVVIAAGTDAVSGEFLTPSYTGAGAWVTCCRWRMGCPAHHRARSHCCTPSCWPPVSCSRKRRRGHDRRTARRVRPDRAGAADRSRARRRPGPGAARCPTCSAPRGGGRCPAISLGA